MTTIETITMRQIADLAKRAEVAGNLKLRDAARRAERTRMNLPALKRCCDAINGTSAEGKRLAKFEAAAKPACTCPPLPLRDPACPEHGIDTLTVPADLQRYDYLDGITVHAASQEAADRMHAAMVERRNRPKA